jgi:glycosyltransferase involved in cell wall biosynthesis
VERTARLNAYYQTDRWTLPRMDHVIAVSDDLYQRARELGVAAARCTLIRNAIDHTRFRRSRCVSDAKQYLGLDTRSILIGSAGRLSKEKGFEDLIRAVDKILESVPQVQLMILGEGQQRSSLQELIDRLGRQGAIHLVGHQADMISWLEAMDVFALSSLREGLPNVLLEAMSMEVPVVATSVAGIPAIIQQDQTGLLVTAGDQNQLASALQRLILDESLRGRLADRARALICEQFSFRQRMRRVRQVYESILGVPADMDASKS